VTADSRLQIGGNLEAVWGWQFGAGSLGLAVWGRQFGGSLGAAWGQLGQNLVAILFTLEHV